MTSRFRVICAPGSYWAKPAQAAARVNRLRDRDDVALIFLTEVNRDQYAALKGRAGWKQTKVGEIAFTWSTDVLRARPTMATAVLAVVLTAVVFFTGKGGRKEGVTAAVLRVKLVATGRKGRVTGFHAPSSIQNGLTWSDKQPRVDAAQETFTSVGRKARRCKRRHPRWFQLVLADFNLDMHRDKWVAYLEGTLDLSCWWVGHRPARGDHHDRLIGGGFTYGLDVEDAQVLNGDPAHDHDPDEALVAA